MSEPMTLDQADAQCARIADNLKELNAEMVAAICAGDRTRMATLSERLNETEEQAQVALSVWVHIAEEEASPCGAEIIAESTCIAKLDSYYS